jgi:hypothetical protein
MGLQDNDMTDKKEKYQIKCYFLTGTDCRACPLVTDRYFQPLWILDLLLIVTHPPDISFSTRDLFFVLSLLSCLKVLSDFKLCLIQFEECGTLFLCTYGTQIDHHTYLKKLYPFEDFPIYYTSRRSHRFFV